MGQPMLFECMGICVLSPAHESEMTGYLVYLLIVKYLSNRFCLNSAKVHKSQEKKREKKRKREKVKTRTGRLRARRTRETKPVIHEEVDHVIRHVYYRLRHIPVQYSNY